MRQAHRERCSRVQVNVASGLRAAWPVVAAVASLCPVGAGASARSGSDGALPGYGVVWPGDRPPWDDGVVGARSGDFGDGPIASPPRGLHRFLRTLRHVAADHAQVARGPLDGVGDSLGKGAKKAMEAAKEAAQTAGKTLQKARDTVEKVKRPLMQKIDKMRAQLCWTRADLWAHKDCLKFLGLKCSDKSTGSGVCSKFKEGVQEHCEDDRHPESQEGFCDLAKVLKIYRAKAPAPASSAPAPAPAPDMDGDGIPDSEDLDMDGDGQLNEADAFPRDPKEWADLDNDGIGDNADPDRDGDGVPNEKDSHPEDPAVSNDRDGDGVPDDKDAFPDDPKESSDLDGDGIGDNADPDRDGDGVPNELDVDPNDPHKTSHDRDGDGVDDAEDDFPDDPKEWLDSDGDGVGDNEDYAPHDKTCWEKPCQSEIRASPDDLNKRGLPSQGYDEHSDTRVKHEDGRTWTDDWRREWPRNAETHHESVTRICLEHPDNAWCKRYHARREER